MSNPPETGWCPTAQLPLSIYEQEVTLFRPEVIPQQASEHERRGEDPHWS